MTAPEQASPPAAAARVKECCAAAYSSDVVRLLLGDSYHPGGLGLTRRLATLLRLQPGQRVLDIATGRGTSALLLAGEFGVRVQGVDLSETNIAAATALIPAQLADQVTFTVADAETLPYPDASFDAVITECAFCTFPDKPTAAAEFTRVLRPGGRLGITDVTAHPDRLPPELTTMAAAIACIADARSPAEYVQILAAAGLRTLLTESHDPALLTMLDQIEARLTLIRMTAHHQARDLGIDFDQAPLLLAAARAAIGDTALGYLLIIADHTTDPPEPAPTVALARATRDAR